MKIGFTGTRQGMTYQQEESLMALLKEVGAKEFRHGCCLGADEQAHMAVNDYNYDNKENKIGIHAHPPTNKFNAFEPYDCESIAKPRPFLDRNKDIVDKSDALIATPKSYEHEMRSGTWSTIRYAEKLRKQVFVIYPDGMVQRKKVRR